MEQVIQLWNHPVLDQDYLQRYTGCPRVDGTYGDLDVGSF